MEESKYVRLEATKRRPIRLVSKRRLSEQMAEVKIIKPYLIGEQRDLLVDNDYGFIDTLQYESAFGLAAHMGHKICRLEDFMEFLQSLRSGKAVDENGKTISKTESDAILEDILAKKDSFNKKYTIHGERFASRLAQESGKIFLLSYGVNGEGSVIASREVAEYVKESRVNSSNFNAQGFPTKKGRDWTFVFPGSLLALSKRNEEHAPLEFATNSAGNNMLIGSYIGVNGIYRGLGFRLLTSPDLVGYIEKVATSLKN